MRSAFTLLELLIVMVIVGIVYSVGFSRFKLYTPPLKALTPLDLKQTIMHNKGFKGHGTLLCVDECTKCYVREDISQPYVAYDGGVSLKGTKSYTLDADGSLVKMRYGRYDDKDVCFMMDFFPNGSSTQLIIQQKDRAYFLPAFFSKPKEFSSVEDAKEYWLADEKRLKDAGSYY